MSKSKAAAAKSKVKEVEVELPSFSAGPRCTLPVWDDAQIEQENWGASLENIVTDERDRMKSVYGSEIVSVSVTNEPAGGKRKQTDNIGKEDEDKFVDNDGRALLETYMAAYYCAHNKPQEEEQQEEKENTNKDGKLSDCAGVAPVSSVWTTATDNNSNLNEQSNKAKEYTYSPLPVRWSRFSEIVQPFRPVIHYNYTPFVDPYASKTELRPLCQFSAMEKTAKEIKRTQSEKSVDVSNDKTKSRSTTSTSTLSSSSSKHTTNEQGKRTKGQKNATASSESNKRNKSSVESQSNKPAAHANGASNNKSGKDGTASAEPSTATSGNAIQESAITHCPSPSDAATGREAVTNADAIPINLIEEEVYEEYSKSIAALYPEIVTPVGNDTFTAADRMAHLHYWNRLAPSEVLEEYRRVEEFMSPYDETDLSLDEGVVEKTAPTNAKIEPKIWVNGQSRYSTALRYKVQQAEALCAMSVAPPFVMRAFNSMLHGISILSKQMNNIENESHEQEQQNEMEEHEAKKLLEETSEKQEPQQGKHIAKKEEESCQQQEVESKTSTSHERKIDKGNYLWELIYPHAPGTCHPVYNPYGKYAVKLFIDGAFRKVVVDDVMPVDELGRPLLTITTRKEFWPALLAKAILKALSLKCPPISNTMPNNMGVAKNDFIAHTTTSTLGIVDATSNEAHANSAYTNFDTNKLAMLDSLRLFYDSPEQLGMYLVGNLIPEYITAVHGRVDFVRYLMQWQLQEKQAKHEDCNVRLTSKHYDKNNNTKCDHYGTHERLVLCAVRSVNEVTSHCISRQLYTIDQVTEYANTLAVHVTTCPSIHLPMSTIDLSELTKYQNNNTTNNINNIYSNTKTHVTGEDAMPLAEKQCASNCGTVPYSSSQASSLLVCAPPLLHSSRVITSSCLSKELCKEEEEEEELQEQPERTQIKVDAAHIKGTDNTINTKTNKHCELAMACEVKCECWVTVEELMEMMEELIVWRFVNSKMQNLQAGKTCDREEQMVSIEYNTLTNSVLPIQSSTMSSVSPHTLMSTESNPLAHNANVSNKLSTQAGGASAKHRTLSAANTMLNKAGNVNTSSSSSSNNRLNAMSNTCADNTQVMEREVWWRVECTELASPITIIGFFASPSIYEKIASATPFANESNKWESKQQTISSAAAAANNNKPTRDSAHESKRNRKVTLTTRAESEESCGLPTIVEVNNLSTASNTNKDMDNANTATNTQMNDTNNTTTAVPPLPSTLPGYLVQPAIQHVSFQLYNAMRSEPLSDAFTLSFPQGKLSCHAIHLPEHGIYLYRVCIPHMHVHDKLTFCAQGTMQLFEQLQDAERASNIYTIVDADYYDAITFPSKPVVWFKRVLSVSETTELTALLSTLGAEADPQLHRVLPQVHNLTQSKTGKALLNSAAKPSMTASTLSPNVSVSHSTGGYSALSLSSASTEAAVTSAMSINNNTTNTITQGNNNNYSSSSKQSTESKDDAICNKQNTSCAVPILHKITLILIDLDSNKVVVTGMMGQLVNVRLLPNVHGYMLMAYTSTSDYLHSEHLQPNANITETDNKISHNVSSVNNSNCNNYMIDNANKNCYDQGKNEKGEEAANVLDNVQYSQRVMENDKTQVNVAGTTNIGQSNTSRAMYDKGMWKLVIRTTRELKSFEPVAHALSVNQHKGKVERDAFRSCNSPSKDISISGNNDGNNNNEKRCVIFKQQCVVNEPTHISVHVELLNKLNIPFRVRVVKLCDRLLTSSRHGNNSSNSAFSSSSGPNANNASLSTTITINANKHANSSITSKNHRDSNANSMTSQHKQSASFMESHEEVEVVLYNSDELFNDCFVPNIFLTTEAITTAGVNNDNNNKHTDTSNNNSNNNNEVEGKMKNMVYVVECSVKETHLIAWQEQCQCEQNNKFIQFFRKTVRDNKEKYKTEMELAQNDPEEFIAMKRAEHEKRTLERQRLELSLQVSQKQQQEQLGGLFTSSSALSSGLDTNADKMARSNASNSTSKQRRSLERKKLLSASNNALNSHDQMHTKERNSNTNNGINDDDNNDHDNKDNKTIDNHKVAHYDEGGIAWLDELENDLTIRFAWTLMFSSQKVDVNNVPTNKDAVESIMTHVHPVLMAMREYTHNVLTSHENVTLRDSSAANELHLHLTNRVNNAVDGATTINNHQHNIINNNNTNGTTVNNNINNNNNGVNAPPITRSTSLSNKSGPNAMKNKQTKESTNVLLSSSLSPAVAAAAVSINTATGNTALVFTSFASYFASFDELHKFIGQDNFINMIGSNNNGINTTTVINGNDVNVNSVNEFSNNNVQNTVLHATQAQACREEFLRNPLVTEFPQVSFYLSNNDTSNVSTTTTTTTNTTVDAVHANANSNHNNINANTATNSNSSSNHHRSHHRSLSNQSLTSSLSTSPQSTQVAHHRSNKTSVVPIAEKPQIIMPYQGYNTTTTSTRESDGVSNSAMEEEDDIRIIRHCWFATPLSPAEESVTLTPLYAFSEHKEEEEATPQQQDNDNKYCNNNNNNNNVCNTKGHEIKSSTRVNARAINAANTSQTINVTNGASVVNNVDFDDNNIEIYSLPSTTPMSSYANHCHQELGNTASLTAPLLSYMSEAQIWSNKSSSSEVEHQSTLDTLRTAVQSYWQNKIEVQDKSDDTNNDKVSEDQKVTEKTLKSILANNNGYINNKADDFYGASNANRHRRSVNNNNINNKTEALLKHFKKQKH